MNEGHTTIAVQKYLGELARLDGDAPVEPIILGLIENSVSRLHLLCRSMLLKSYPRLMHPPLNLQTEEMLSAVVDRLLKALQKVRPATVRQFFALANQHIRWELNDLARHLDSQTPIVELKEAFVAAADTGDSQLSPNALRMLDAIETLPDDEREVFSLVRIQGLSHAEAADILGVATKTIQRRLQRSLVLLAEKLGDLSPAVMPQE